MSADRDFAAFAMMLIILGFTLVVMGIFLSLIGSLPTQSVKGGGLILIGPIPLIITGSGEAFISIFLIMLVLVILSIIIFLLVARKLLHRSWYVESSS